VLFEVLDEALQFPDIGLDKLNLVVDFTDLVLEVTQLCV